MKHLKKQNRNAGFTLVEIMLVVVIIGIIAAIAVPKIAGLSGESKVTAAKAEMANIGTALDLYEIRNGSYPASLNEVASYMKAKKVPTDPWGNPYVYARSNDGYTIHSGGDGSGTISVGDE